jgi:hypothetical protein
MSHNNNDKDNDSNADVNGNGNGNGNSNTKAPPKQNTANLRAIALLPIDHASKAAKAQPSADTVAAGKVLMLRRRRMGEDAEVNKKRKASDNDDKDGNSGCDIDTIDIEIPFRPRSCTWPQI